jgi:hypothetical protein
MYTHAGRFYHLEISGGGCSKITRPSVCRVVFKADITFWNISIRTYRNTIKIDITADGYGAAGAVIISLAISHADTIFASFRSNDSLYIFSNGNFTTSAAYTVSDASRFTPTSSGDVTTRNENGTTSAVALKSSADA